MEIDAKRLKFKKDVHLHSPSHLLADELANKFSDRRRFGFYLKMALTHNHGLLRRIASEVLEKKNVKNPGALFVYLTKQYSKTVKNT